MEIITIKTILGPKTAKNGASFWVAEYAGGTASIWEKDLADELVKHIGVAINAEIKGDQYKNIRSFSPINSVVNSPVAVAPEPIREIIKEKNKDTIRASMLTSYAKDILVSHPEMKPTEAQTLIMEIYDFFLERL